MKMLSLALLSLLAISCSSGEKNDVEDIQREEEIQMQEEERSRTGASEEMSPGYTSDSSFWPYSEN